MANIPSSPQGLLPAFKPTEPKISIHQDDANVELGTRTPPCSSPPPPHYNDFGDGEEEDDDDEQGPKSVIPASKSLRQAHYPTPQPSSSLGFSSPPPAEEKRSESPFAPLAEQSRSFVVRSPLSTVALVRVSRDGNEIKIGRSSKSCQVALGNNKLVSRVHAKVWYSSSEQEQEDHETKKQGFISIRCEGWNGLRVAIPKYTKELVDTDEVMSRGFPAAHGQDEYDVYQGETMEVRYVPGIIIDIRGERALVELLDENSCDDTEDELLSQIVDRDPSKPVESFEAEHPVGDVEPHGSDKENNCVGAAASAVTTTNHQELDQKHKKRAPLSELPVAPAKESNKHQEKKESSKLQDKKKHNKQSNVVVGEKEKDPSAAETPIETAAAATKTTKRQTDTVPATRPTKKIKTEAPKSTTHVKEEKEDQEFQQLDESEIANIKHIIANHLAFSRLAQSPISVIQKSNSVLSALPKQQLREILQHIDCVGIIQRSGKDAAGKPLEEEYYYEVSNDDDEHRLTMVQQVRGGGGLRSCRKTHKQYFWKKPARR